jgi:hypothetical protein
MMIGNLERILYGVEPKDKEPAIAAPGFEARLDAIATANDKLLGRLDNILSRM